MFKGENKNINISVSKNSPVNASLSLDGYKHSMVQIIALTIALKMKTAMLSTDLKTDCLFAHEVTVRPLENGRFQYVGNKVTYQTEYGLPFCEPRITWNER